ncbi:MAG: B12-binding domain-containing radical SAM protein [Candidatus Omnitrophica bacterium CG23_combo_of_CG06-09_8_20_14_all_40_11]|nr:MAG: B12-binding domain-containing radical SAM protein [Candidatus Omnitrophica bacterium CG23_combo_of_CG06-09_8_20_14_all_40_11]
MKIIISYPPFSGVKGIPLLSQNRQYQVFSEKTVIYPIVPAQAATLLRQSGHEVIWNDCIAEGWSYDKFLEFIQKEKPDLIAFETKTPVIKQHWKIISDIKGQFPSRLNQSNLKGTVPKIVPKIVLFGDHVTALPEESFQNSQVDFVLSGGDYDFLLLNLCNFLEKKGLSPQNMKGLSPKGTDPEVKTKGAVPDNIELESGIHYRDNGQIKNTGRFQLNHNLDSLPFIDRDLTQWRLYAYKNGNYKRTPGTYIMSGRDCWHREGGGCTFCAWPLLYPEFRVRKVDNVLDEIGTLIEKYNIKEIMDDTGTFPAGDWLRKFCRGTINRGYNRKIYLDCNMRFGALSYEDFSLMKRANFRLLLFGLESANQKTLDKINKNLKVERIIQDCKSATKAGLYPHITIMFGYPWETYEDALKTLKLGRQLLKKGYAYTMQATVAIPYPGTPLFEECKQKNLLKTFDWDGYDMKSPVMKTRIENNKLMGLVQGMYKASFQPEFILRKIFSLRDLDDLNYYLRAAKKVAGHIFDFKKGLSATDEGSVPEGD